LISFWGFILIISIKIYIKVNCIKKWLWMDRSNGPFCKFYKDFQRTIHWFWAHFGKKFCRPVFHSFPLFPPHWFIPKFRSKSGNTDSSHSHRAHWKTIYTRFREIKYWLNTLPRGMKEINQVFIKRIQFIFLVFLYFKV
jgi:hypothetical protein